MFLQNQHKYQILTIYNTILPFFKLKESFDYKPTTYSLFDDEASFISTNSFILNFFKSTNPNVRFTFLRVNRTAPKIYYYLFFVKKREPHKNNVTDMVTWKWRNVTRKWRNVTWQWRYVTVAWPDVTLSWPWLIKRERPITSAWPFRDGYHPVTVTVTFTVIVNVCFKSLIWMFIFTKTSSPASVSFFLTTVHQPFTDRPPNFHATMIVPFFTVTVSSSTG